MSNAESTKALLAAGALLPPKTAIPKGELVDTVEARAYQHPALLDRVVVRLSAETLAVGDDLEMEVLGFNKPEACGVVGIQRRRSLGFPGWALIHDPKHARYALSVLKDFKKHARRALSKPGHVKTGFDEIGAILGRSVPHFLPSFYEEAGRVFLDAGTTMYAAQCFGKARDAERVHALEIDEDLRRDAFLEFALSGAVTIKAISTYGKDLTKSHDASGAYEHFRTLCVRRTLGGMPPWGSMAKDLRRMAKAAGLLQDTEDAKFLGEIIESPSLANARGEFWKSYRKPLLVMAKESSAVRGTLLNLFPDTNSSDFSGWWIELLGECGALEGVCGDDAPADAQPNGSAAAWLSKLANQVAPNWRHSGAPTQVFSLIRRMAAKLIRETTCIQLRGSWNGIELDVCDLCLELKIPLFDPEEHDSFRLRHWVDSAEEPERGRDPVYVAGDKRFARLLNDQIGSQLGKTGFESLSQGKPGFYEAKKLWYQTTIQRASNGALPALHEVLEQLRESTTTKTFREFSESYQALQDIDVSEMLARSLRGGLFDELGWPAAEQAAAELDGELELHGAFPNLILTNQIRAIVVGPQERLLEHDFRIPKGASIMLLRYVQEQLLVCYRDDSYDRFTYWSSAPKKTFSDESSYSSQGLGNRAVYLEDGGLCEGGRALYAGDTGLSSVNNLSCDGTTFWEASWQDSEFGFREFNPKTGQKGRRSLPDFLSSFTRPGMALDSHSSWIIPLPSEIADSPLGAANGSIGFRVRKRDEEQAESTGCEKFECEAIDGRRFVGDLEGADPKALLRLPGDSDVRPVCIGYSYREVGDIDLWNPDGSYQVACVASEDRGYMRGSAFHLPLGWWHCLQFRDEKGSQALRAISEEDASRFLNAISGRVTSNIDEDRGIDLEPELGKVLSTITNPLLRRGVYGVVEVAARISISLKRLIRDRDPANQEADFDLAHVSEDDARPLLYPFIPQGYTYGSDCVTEEWLAITTFFRREGRSETDRVREPSQSEIRWTELLHGPSAMAFAASRPYTTDKQRNVWIRLLKHWSRSVFTDSNKSIRYYQTPLEKVPYEKDEDVALCSLRGNDYSIGEPENRWDIGNRSKRHPIIEYAPSGEFQALDGAVEKHEIRYDGSLFNSDKIAELITLLTANEVVEWDPSIVEILADRTGLSRAEASILWLGLPEEVDKDTRKGVDLKAGQVSTAQEMLSELTARQKVVLFASAVPDDLSQLWRPLGDGPEDSNSSVAKLAAAWVEQFGKRVPISEELLVDASKDLKTPLATSAVFALLSGFESAPALNQDGSWSIDDDTAVVKGLGEGEKVFDGDVLLSLVLYIPYLFFKLPVGDPIVANLPVVLNLARERLANKNLLLAIGNESFYEDDWKSAQQTLLDSVGGKDLKAPLVGKDNSAFVAMLDSRYIRIWFRPGEFRGEADWKQAAAYHKSFYSWGLQPITACEVLLSDGYSAIAERITNSPVPVGSYEANPLHSASAIVTQACEKFELTEDAAVLYLQTLTLLSPQRKSVLLWNDWKAARYKKACAELVDKKLLLEAKRARAGRTHFLPGGWEALKSPDPAMETWKLSLYQITRDEEGKLEAPLSRFMALKPPHTLFEEAWQRVLEGDTPAYDKVKS